VDVKGRPRRDSREDRRADNPASWVVSDGEYCKVYVF